jgi:hypothetical protein
VAIKGIGMLSFNHTVFLNGVTQYTREQKEGKVSAKPNRRAEQPVPFTIKVQEVTKHTH